MPSETEEKFDEEVNRWISEGCLLPCEASEQGIVPTIAMVQETKVRTGVGVQGIKQMCAEPYW